MDTGVARQPIVDMDAYRQQLRTRRDPIAGMLQRIFERVRRTPKRVVFAEGEEEQVIRAAASFVHAGTRHARILIGREERVRETARNARHRARRRHRDHQRPPVAAATPTTPTISTSACSARATCIRDCQRLVNQDRNHFAACMVALGDADAHGDRRDPQLLGRARATSAACIDPKPGHRLIGVSIVLARGRTVLVADTAVNEMPTAEELADIAVEAAGVARRLGHEPRVALLSFSTFGHPPGERVAARARGGRHPRPAPGRFRV